MSASLPRIAAAVGLALLVAFAAAADAAPAVTIQPSVIQIGQSLEFDAKGKPGREGSSFQLTLNGTYSAPMRVVEYANVSVSEAVTDSGEALVIPQEHAAYNRSYNGGDRKLSFTLALSVPRQPCLRLKSVKGALDVIYTTAKLKEAEFKPLKEWLGKHVQLDGVDNGMVTIIRLGTGISLLYNKATEQVISDVKFHDSAGSELDCHGWSGGSRNATDFNRDFHVDVPDDGAVVVQLNQELKTVAVPFVLTDIPLPGHADKRIDAVIHPKDAVEGKPNAKPTGAAPDNF